MILEPGFKILIAHRRLFKGDHCRYFTGIVEAYEAGIARVTGHSWLRDGYRGSFTRKDDERTKIVPITSGMVFVYQLPGSVDIAKLEVRTEGTDVVMTDGHGFRMDLTEGVLRGGDEVPTYGSFSA